MWKCRERNLNTASVCQSCGCDKVNAENSESDAGDGLGFWERQRIETEKREREQLQQRQKEKIQNLTDMGYEGYYEYKVVSLCDEGGLFNKNSGKINVVAMSEKLNSLGLEGWRLVTAYSNELGKNALSGGAGGALFGVNSTVDENILIFERFVKVKREND